MHPDVFTRIRARASRTTRSSWRSSARTTTASPRVGIVAGVPQPAPPRRPSALGRAGAQSFWAGLGAVRRHGVRRGRRVRRRALPGAVDRGHRARRPARRRRDGSLLDPALQGTHLKEWTLRSMVETDFSGAAVCRGSRCSRSTGTMPATLNLGASRARERAQRRRVAGRGAATQAPARRGGRRSVPGRAQPGPASRLLLERLGPEARRPRAGSTRVHQLTAVAAVPVGLARHARRRRRAPDRSAPPHVPTATP